MFDVLLVVGGLISLFVGGESVVRGASKIARQLGMSPLMVGLTIVALGTSSPELAICLDAVWKGNPEIAFGNIVGSNISNILLILGATAIVIPITVDHQVVRKEVPIMIGVTVIFLIMTLDGVIDASDGTLLVSLMGFLLVLQVRWGDGSRTAVAKVKQTNEYQFADPQQPFAETIDNNHEQQETVPPDERNFLSLVVNLFLMAMGVALLWLGSGWMVKGASNIAAMLGVSQLVIGLTIVAIGSSAPELVTSLMAAFRGQPELALGNVVGSNVANILLVLGASASFSSGIPVPPESLQFDVPVMMAASIACLPVLASGKRIDRWEGFLFLFCYAAFVAVLYLQPKFEDFLPSDPNMAFWIGVPLAVATLYVLASRRRFFKA